MLLLRLLLGTLIITNVYGSSKTDQDESPRVQKINPILKGWWRGLNASDSLSKNMSAFVTAILEDPFLHSSHPAFHISNKWKNSLAFVVPVAYFAHGMKYDVKHFVKCAQYTVDGGEHAARLFALVMKILMDRRQTTTVLDKKTTLETHLQELHTLMHMSLKDSTKFSAYEALFNNFYKSDKNTTHSSPATKQVVHALDWYFKSLDNKNESQSCKNTQPNNVTRALSFALLNISNESEEITKSCSNENASFPDWLEKLSNKDRNDLGFNKPFSIERAKCVINSAAESDGGTYGKYD